MIWPSRKEFLADMRRYRDIPPHVAEAILNPTPLRRILLDLLKSRRPLPALKIFLNAVFDACVIVGLIVLSILDFVRSLLTTHPVQVAHVMAKPLKYALMGYAAAGMFFIVEALIWWSRKKRNLARFRLIKAGLAVICCGLLWLLSR